jgi:hypothetical protein
MQHKEKPKFTIPKEEKNKAEEKRGQHSTVSSHDPTK